jgi:DNA-directed RNA polymerase omega subunit
MQKAKFSRSSDIDTEKCVEMIGGNRFDLVIAASARARELARAHRQGGTGTQLNAPITALLDIQEGRVTKNYLYKK